MPRVGAWRADLTIDASDASALTPSQTLTLGEGASTWVGTLYRGSPVFGRAEARIVGGQGGLAKALAGASYVNASASVVLTDILTGAGEALSPNADAAPLAVTLRAWSRLAGPASYQLTHLLASLSLAWRVLQDGTVWVGAESWPDAAAFDFDLLEERPIEGRDVLGTTAGYALLPGTTFGSKHVEYVEHRISDDALRTHVWYS